MSEAVAEEEFKVFISYAWTSPEHKAWVRRLAERITEDGVYTILDDWDLGPGKDPIFFMEQSITSPAVKKVLIVCDRTYKEKADGRAGGVGTETQILTPELYQKADQSKYAALVTEVDDAGKPFIPTFYGGRIFIDFSDTEREEEAYEELTRWINDAPLHERPKLGRKPSYLARDDEKPLVTQSRFKRAKEGLERRLTGSTGLLRDFGEALVEQLVELRPAPAIGQRDDRAFIQAIVSSADQMRPYVLQLHELGRAVARSDDAALSELTDILERVLATTVRDPSARSWTEAVFDTNKIIAYEAFLGITAVMLAERRLDMLSTLLDHAYYLDESLGAGRSTREFDAFNAWVETMRYRNQYTSENKADWQGEFISNNYGSARGGVPAMIEADLLLFVRQTVKSGEGGMWFPHTLLYAARTGTAVQLFARMESRRYFEEVSGRLFGGATIPAFTERLQATEGQRLWDRVFPGPSIRTLVGLEYIGVRP